LSSEARSVGESFVLFALHAVVIRVVLAPGVHDLAGGLDDQLGIVVIVVAHR
jgi:hypothetical protein